VSVAAVSLESWEPVSVPLSESEPTESVAAVSNVEPVVVPSAEVPAVDEDSLAPVVPELASGSAPAEIEPDCIEFAPEVDPGSLPAAAPSVTIDCGPDRARHAGPARIHARRIGA
jgi:hypothetical protein